MTSKEKAGEILQKQGNNNNKYSKDPGPQIYVSNNNKNFGLNPAQSLFNIYQCLTLELFSGEVTTNRINQTGIV